MISLLELEPDFAVLLPAGEREIAGRVRVPVHTVGGKTNADVGALLGEAEAFGMAVLEGLLLHRLRVRDHVGVRLLGAGDVVIPGRDPGLMCLEESALTAGGGTRLALLGEAVLSAARRWPELMLRLLDRAAETSQVLEAQLMICQLPRVDHRLSAMLWLLAERWGRVTSSGTYLPLQLTHQTLGALIGARRPTVTLALAELADHGELIRRADGWLLLAPPPNDDAIPAMLVEMPRFLSSAASPWQAQTPQQTRSHATVGAYFEAIRAESRRERDSSARQRERSRALCERSHQLRRPAASRPDGRSLRA